MNIPVIDMSTPALLYKPRTSRIADFYFYKLTTLLFIVLSVLLAFVAWHNAKPLNCDDVIYDAQHNVRVCEVTLK